MYADRGARPGFARILATLFQVTVVAVIFAIVSGANHFSSYYIFYGSFFFALVYVSAFRLFYERGSGALLRAAGYRRRAVLVGTGQHIEAVANALAASPAPAVEIVGFICSRAASREWAALARLAGRARHDDRAQPRSTR